MNFEVFFNRLADLDLVGVGVNVKEILIVGLGQARTLFRDQNFLNGDA